MDYTPTNVPLDPKRLPEFLRSELKRISEALGLSVDLLRVAVRNVSPDKPRTGDIRLPDGTNWDPITAGFEFVWWDGDSWMPFGTKYDVGFFLEGKPTASLLMSQFVTPRAFTLPASFTGSKGYATVAATAQTDLDVRKVVPNTSDASVGTIRWAASAKVPTFIASSAVSFAVGDVLQVIAPATPDATLTNISATFKGRRA